MENRKTYDLTQGSILNKLLLIALPVMGTQFIQMAYNLTDMFWLGRVSSDAVAASGSAGMYLWLSMGLMMVGRVGAEIGVSQNIGKGDLKTARAFSQTALLLAAVLGVLYGGVLIAFSGPLIGFFNIQEAAVAKDAAIYLSIVGAAMPMTYITSTLGGSFSGSGNSRIPFYINAVGLVFNIILDPILITYMEMGIAGAAIATAISQTVVCVLFLIAIKKSRGRPFEEYKFLPRLERRIVAQIFKWSIPVGLETTLFCFLTMVISRFVAAFGSDALAIQRVGSQIESLSWLIGGGFATAVTSYIGQNYGAGKWSRIHRGMHLSAWIMSAWGVFVTVVLVFGARFLVSVFLTGEDIISGGVTYLRILSTCQFIYCLEALAAGAFRGLGKTLPPSLATAVGNTIRIPIVYGLSKTALGINGIWWGVALGAILRSLILIIWYVVDSRKQPREDIPAARAEIQAES